MQYVKGFPKTGEMPSVSEILKDPRGFGYEPLAVTAKPGTTFKYSGGGFLVLEYLIECLSGKKISELTTPFLSNLGHIHSIYWKVFCHFQPTRLFFRFFP
jgi:hypothetical protein